MKKVEECSEIIYKYRFYIAAAIFLFCILFELSGSSIGMWKQYINSDTTEGVILGKSRGIRSDEWAVYTPMVFSQFKDGFKYFSDIIRGGNTDVFIVYGLPVLNLVQIFRPFQLGFLFLGVSKGLSFFWCGRFIALFLVMFELAMIITNKNKLLSLIGAVLITLAPIIQWWFAIDGIAELFIFGGLLIILLKQYLTTDNLYKRCGYLLLMDICAGGYALILYPAWQIPIAYAFLSIAIWVIINYKKEIKINIKDIISIIIALLIFIASMGYVFSQSFETIKTVMNTVYPGARCEIGGNAGKSFFYYIMNIFLPFKESGLATNTCEESLFFTLFPIGIIICIFNVIKTKKIDTLSVCLLIAYIFLSLWCIIGFPKIIAKLTLLSNSQASRSMLAVGFLDILILIRSLAIMKEPLKRVYSIIISVILTLILVIFNIIEKKEYLTIWAMSLCMAIMCLYLFYFICRYKAKYANYLLACGIIFVMLMSGATINPIRMGTNIIYGNKMLEEIEQMNKNDYGNWIIEELGFPYNNYLLMAGVPVLNSTNVYPNIDRWSKIDQKEEYKDIYNRYAHITIKLVKDDKDIKEKFELQTPDSFKVYITPHELKELNVKYIFTINQLEQYNSENIEIKLIYEFDNYKVYKIEFKDNI